MKRVGRFVCGMLFVSAVLGLLFAAGSPHVAWGGADTATERKVEELEREVDDLRRQLEDFDKRLKERERAIEVTSSGIAMKASRIEIDASFSLDLNANTIRLNNGRQAVARVGSKVDAKQGVVDGARSVLVP